MFQVSFPVLRVVLISQIKVSAHFTKVTKHRHCVCKEFVALVVGIHETVYNVCLH